jgi:ABC-type antimicrobial peptide transport system permease subunit
MNLIKGVLRSLNKFRLYTIVNIIGLSISLACTIIIFRYVHQETTVNHFIKDLNRTYLLSVENPENNRLRFGGLAINDISRITLPPLLRESAIQSISTFIAFDEDFIIQNNSRTNVKSIAIDSNFFEMLPYPLLYGNKELNTTNEVIITDKFAKKIFGDENPVEKRFQYSAGDELEVTGVIGSPTSKSFLDVDILINREQRQFGAMQPYTMVKLYPNSNVTKLNEYNRELVEPRLFAPNQVRISLFTLSDFYFDKTHEFTNLSLETTLRVFNQGNRNSVLILIVVGLLIFLIGLFNLINIFTVISVKREKELGLKSLFGAKNYQIFFQYFLEIFAITLISLFFSWLLIEVFEHALASFLGFIVMKNIKISILISIIILTILPLLAGLYPYLKFRYSNHIALIQLSSGSKASLSTRKSILIVQYILTFALIVVALFFTKQLNFMLNTDPGYNVDNIIMARMMHRDMSTRHNMDSIFKKNSENIVLIKERMNQSPLFSNWEFGVPLYNLEARASMKRVDKNNYNQVKTIRMSKSYIDIFQFNLLEGRFWDDSDSDSEPICIINEATAKLFEIDDLQNVKLEFQLERDNIDRPQYQIVGIIKDFHTGHLSKATIPVVILYTKEGFHFDYLFAQFINSKENEAIAYLDDIYKEINNDAEFEYSILEEEIEDIYSEDKRVKSVYVLFSIIAILVSCLGLFSLSLYDLQQRHREIALRKINGATNRDIMNLLLNKYMFVLLVSFLISIPLSYISIHKFLENFVFKAVISWWIFALSGIIVTGVSLLTLTWQVTKAMRINPVESIKSE